MSELFKLDPSDIKALDKNDYKEVISDDNTRVLKQDFEKVVHSPEFKVLGFLNNYMYTAEGIYLSKSTLNGYEIAKMYLEVSHATFYEGCKFFYCWFENILYKITQNLEIEWSRSFDLQIKCVYMDCRGDCYLLFESSRTIRKILKNNEDSVYIDGSDDPTKEVLIQDLFVTKGAGWLFVLGTEYWDYDNKSVVFIDKYNTRTWDKVDRLEINQNNFVSMDNPDYLFQDFVINGDIIYLFSNTTLSKINIKGIPYWSLPTPGIYDSYMRLEYTDNNYSDFLHYGIMNSETNGFTFGKLQTNGRSVWYLQVTDSDEFTDFNWAYYQSKIYTSIRAYVQPKKGYILSVNDDRYVFQTRDNHLVKVIEYNTDELYSADNYYGMRLLAAKIKDGIEKIEYCPLLHDDGDMINEDENLLLLPLENEHYTDAENYDYMYLLCSRYRIEPPELSLIYTKKMMQPILTKLKNVIKTKTPVLPDKAYEFLTNNEDKTIDTARNFDLIRARFKYSYDKYLLADLNMFSTDIITKALGYTIITKKYGHDIIMKTRQVYSYVLSKYSDLDMIAEWLKENGVMDTNLPKYVEELRHHTLDAIQDVQVAGTPQIYDVNAYKQFEYTFDGYKYPNNTWGTQIFSCTNLPWDKRKCVAKIYIDSLANIIKKQEMRPILFFLNGKAIPWSDCTIVRDWSYSYLLIANHDPYETELSSIIFPCDIRYGEDNKILKPDQTNGYFYFDKNGLSLEYNNQTTFNDKNKVAIRVEVIDKNVWGWPAYYTPDNYSITHSGNTVQGFEVLNKQEQISTERNIIAFKKDTKTLDPDAIYSIKYSGKDVYTIYGEEYPYKIKAFYWIKANDYYGLENKPENQQLMLENSKNKVCEHHNDCTVNTEQELDPLYTPFNFKMYRDRTYEDNIANAISYIMKYDSSLLIKYWKEMAQTTSFVFDGEYLINRVPKDGGWLLMPRARKSNFDDYIMVFRNDSIYEYYKEIDYTDCYFKIPIFNHVNRDDKIEIIHFKGVDNSYYTLTVDEDTTDYLPENLRYDNFILFGNSPSNTGIYIPFDRETSVQYDVEFEYKNNFNEYGKYANTEIKLDDKFYYGKELNICSKRQFHYMYYNLFSARQTINLSPDFRFCHDKSKYMVYINGVRVDSSAFKLNVMTNETKLKYISITFSLVIPAGYLVEIFYLPVAIQEAITKNSVPFNAKGDGVHFMPTNLVGIPFDKDLFFIEQNGFKINYNEITNVSKDIFTINTKFKHNENALNPKEYADDQNPTTVFSRGLHIGTFLNYDALLSKLYSYTDLWSNTLKDIKSTDYNLFLKLLQQKNETRK